MYVHLVNTSVALLYLTLTSFGYRTPRTVVVERRIVLVLSHILQLLFCLTIPLGCLLPLSLFFILLHWALCTGFRPSGSTGHLAAHLHLFTCTSHAHCLLHLSLCHSASALFGSHCTFSLPASHSFHLTGFMPSLLPSFSLHCTSFSSAHCCLFSPCTLFVWLVTVTGSLWFGSFMPASYT